MASFGLTLANRGVIIGAVTVPELFDMAKRGEDSGAFSAVWVGDSLLAKPRLESITLLSALAVVTKKVNSQSAAWRPSRTAIRRCSRNNGRAWT